MRVIYERTGLGHLDAGKYGLQTERTRNTAATQNLPEALRENQNNDTLSAILNNSPNCSNTIRYANISSSAQRRSALKECGMFVCAAQFPATKFIFICV